MDISLVIPCYNEEVNLQKGVLDKIGNFTKRGKQFREVIIVDDGSTDHSLKIIKERYLPRFPKFRLIENKHQGKAQAVITGIRKARGSHVIFSDIDLATPIEESVKLINEAKRGYSIVIGSRNANRKGAPLTRKVLAVGFIVIRDMLIGLRGIKDTQCGFKLFNKKAARHILDRLKVFREKKKVEGSSVSAGFDIEFLFLAQKFGYSIKEVPVTWRHVETKNVNFMKDSLETLKDIFTIKYFQIADKYN